jgi:HD-GYP domain-containing protein (c-di-GMP phosphodiesterase class II)
MRMLFGKPMKSPASSVVQPLAPQGAAAAARQICVVSPTESGSQDILHALKADYRSAVVSFSAADTLDLEPHDAFVVDAWQWDANTIAALAPLLMRLAATGRPILLAIGAQSRVALARMGHLVGITTFARPFAPNLFGIVLGQLFAARDLRLQKARASRAALLQVPGHAEALLAADEVLERIFALSCDRRPLDTSTIEAQSSQIIESLAESGIGSWIAGVREHHDSTYQHCLLVTGTAIAFGQQLGFSKHDLRRIAVGSLLHDAGKARIPLDILDKPSGLSAEEFGMMTRHPEFGVEMLAGQSTISEEHLSIVLLHHEYLDGTGYPQGLTAERIPDIIRLVTIADVFSALIENRAYRSPMGGSEAYATLLSMEGKLDLDIVRAIKPTAFKAPG